MSSIIIYRHLNHTIQLVLKDAVGFLNLHKDVIIYLIAPQRLEKMPSPVAPTS